MDANYVEISVEKFVARFAPGRSVSKADLEMAKYLVYPLVKCTKEKDMCPILVSLFEVFHRFGIRC